MSDQPLISILTPTYNHEKYIGACIQSVLDQTWTNWEMIVVNDGSTDQTSPIIRKFAEHEPRIRLFDRENGGVSRLAETYNFALSQSTGEYIAILEGDDFWAREKLAIQLKAMQDDPDTILCWGRATSVIGDDPGVYEVHPKCESKNLAYYSNRPAGSFFNIVFDDFPAPVTFLIKRNTLEEAGQFRQVAPFPAVDLPTILELSKKGPFHYIPEILGSWRQHADQTTKNYPIQLLEGSSKIIIAHYQALPKEIKMTLKFDLDYILKNLEIRKVISYSRSGRFKLIKRQFAEARKDYLSALVIGSPLTAPSWKLRSLAGLLMGFFRMDVEGLARLLGKKSYN